MNLDVFGQAMDKFIKDNNVVLQIKMPAGTITADVQDNLGLGPVVQFYIILNSVETIYKSMLEQMEVEHDDNVLDSILELLKSSIKGGSKDEKR